MKFIHTADIHLDSPLLNLEKYEGAPVEEVRGATRLALRNLVNLALEEEVDFIVISGDLYDGDWRDYNTGLFFLARMAELREAGIGVYIVSGNHDAASRITRSLQMPDNVTMFSAKRPETVTDEDLGVALHGQSYRTSAVMDNLAANYPPRHKGFFNIGLLHTALTGREGHEPYAPCAVKELVAKEYDYWALGHVHRSEIVSRDPWIVFPGNVQGRHPRELGAKGCMLVQGDGHRVTGVEAKEIDVLRWILCEIEVDVDDGEDEILNGLEEEIKRALEQDDERFMALRLVIKGECKAHGKLLDGYERITNETRTMATDIGGGRVWVERVKLETVMPGRPEDTEIDETLGGFLIAISSCEADSSMLEALAKELEALERNLPPGFIEGAGKASLRNPEALRGYFESAKAILVERMLMGGRR